MKKAQIDAKVFFATSLNAIIYITPRHDPHKNCMPLSFLDVIPTRNRYRPTHTELFTVNCTTTLTSKRKP